MTPNCRNNSERVQPRVGGQALRRVAIAIGPQYGTVGPPLIKHAAREALRAADIDLLCVFAFAFDPTALNATEEFAASDQDFASVAAERRLGRIPVLLVRMNSDLVMGENLKKTGAGNLFTVFGSPTSRSPLSERTSWRSRSAGSTCPTEGFESLRRSCGGSTTCYRRARLPAGRLRLSVDSVRRGAHVHPRQRPSVAFPSGRYAEPSAHVLF